MNLADKITAAIRSVTGPGRVGLHEPLMAGNELAYLKDCIDTNYVSSVGAYVDRFEADLAAYTGAARAVAIVNGTAALHLALMLAGVEAGDEVLVPALTFIGTVNPLAYIGAVPHFVDSEERTLGIDPVALREYLNTIAHVENGVCINTGTGRVIRALLPVHTFGHPADLDGLMAVAQDFRLVLVEDAAESIGSTYRGRHTGTFGRIGVLSFNGNKTITTGGGGAILVNDPELGKRAKHLSTTAKQPHRWAFIHDEVGYNYRMPNINAALGCAQLERLDSLLADKRRLHEAYAKAFAGMNDVRLMGEPDGTKSNFWLQALLLDESVASQRDAILAATNDDGVMTRPSWTLVSSLKPYAQSPRMALPVAGSLERRIINIPSSAQLIG
ncbi:MAG TPA: LegC family aminotransferase [Rhizomicrobium sp.]|nr:LegC family aminotransferase [Rhizomicrobium sp.]